MTRIHAGGRHHLGLRVTDMARSKNFYTETVGFLHVLDFDGMILLNHQGTLIGIRGGARETPKSDKFNPFRVGLDHVALAVQDMESLRKIKRHLNSAKVKNNGIEQDKLTKAHYISFHDPDGIAWEMYMMPEWADPATSERYAIRSRTRMAASWAREWMLSRW